ADEVAGAAAGILDAPGGRDVQRSDVDLDAADAGAMEDAVGLGGAAAAADGAGIRGDRVAAGDIVAGGGARGVGAVHGGRDGGAAGVAGVEVGAAVAGAAGAVALAGGVAVGVGVAAVGVAGVDPGVVDGVGGDVRRGVRSGKVEAAEGDEFLEPV